MPGRKARIVWGMAFVLVIGVGIAIPLLFPRERKLLANARRIGSIQTWEQDYPTYSWLSDHEALLSRYESEVAPEAEERLSKFYRYDFQTGQSVPFDKFSALFNKNGSYDLDVQLSPDREWALWKADEGGVMAARLDGTQSVRYPDLRVKAGNLCWLGDSLHWVVLETKSMGEGKGAFAAAILHDLKGPKTLGRIPYVSPITPTDFCLAGGNLTPGAAPDHLLGDTGCWNEVNPTDEIVEFRVGSRFEGIQRHKVTLPPQCEIKDVLYSPQGDRVAWVLQTDYTSPLQALLHRIYPRYQPGGRSVVSVWVCRIDGTQMHEIGHMDLAQMDVATSLPGASITITNTPSTGTSSGASSLTGPEDLMLHWMPDGKHLSFSYQDTLWSAAAD